jgi:hypothetical protein
VSAPFWQPMTQSQTDEIVAAIVAARAAGRVVIAVEFPRTLALARGPWSILGADLIYHSWYHDGFNLKLAGTGAFLHDDEFHPFATGVPAGELPGIAEGIMGLVPDGEDR